MTMVVKSLAEHRRLIRGQARDHLRPIERPADAIRGVVDRSPTQQRHSLLQRIGDISAASEQLDQMRIQITATARWSRGVKTRGKRGERIRIPAAAQVL